MQKTIYHTIAKILLLLTLLVQVLLPTLTHAESGQALSISPPVIELKGDPGQVVTASIKITNVSNGDLLIKNQVNDFGAKGENGDPNIIFDYTKETSYSLQSWVQAPPPFILASKQSKVVQFPITIPSNGEPGGHYAVFRFTGQAPELEETGVAISASLGSLVLLRVSGDIAEKASLVDYYSASPAFEKSSFFETGPISFVQRIRNDGNTHIRPTGTIEIKDIFGRTSGTLRVNGEPGNQQDSPRSILPQSIRKFQETLSTKWMFGRYTADMKLTYGNANVPLESSIVFWVIPYKLILLVIALILITFFLLRFIFRKYNAHIIKLAQKAQTEQPSHTAKHASSKVHATAQGKHPHPAKKPPKK